MGAVLASKSNTSTQSSFGVFNRPIVVLFDVFLIRSLATVRARGRSAEDPQDPMLDLGGFNLPLKYVSSEDSH